MYSYTLYTFNFDGSTQLVCICEKEANGRKQFLYHYKTLSSIGSAVTLTPLLNRYIKGMIMNKDFCSFFSGCHYFWMHPHYVHRTCALPPIKKVSMPFLCLIYITHFHMLIFTCCSLHENKHVISHCSFNRGVFLSFFNPKISLKNSLIYFLGYIYIL